MPPETVAHAAPAAPTTPDAPSVAPASETSSGGSPPPGPGEPSDSGSTPGDKPAEKVVDKEPATDKETAYGRSLRKREVELVAKTQRFSQRLATVDAREAALAKRESELAERAKLIEEDPIGYAAKSGKYRDEDLARRWLNNGAADPKELEHREKTAAEERIATLEKKLAEQQEAIERPQREAKERAAAEQVATEFTGMVKANAKVIPNAARAFDVDAKEAIDTCDAIAQAIRNSGWKGTRDQLWSMVLRRFESNLSKFTGGLTPAAAQAAPKSSEKPDPQETRVDAATGGTTAPTLTGKTASQRSTIAKDDDPLLSVLDPAAAKRKTEKAIEKALAERKAAAH